MEWCESSWSGVRESRVVRGHTVCFIALVAAKSSLNAKNEHVALPEDQQITIANVRRRS